MGSLHPKTKPVNQAPLQKATGVISGAVTPSDTNKIAAPSCQKINLGNWSFRPSHPTNFCPR